MPQPLTSIPARPSRRTLRAFALRLVGQHSDADDLVQETMLRVWLGKRETRTPDLAYVRRVMKNVFVDGYRRKVREHRALDTLKQQAMTQSRASGLCEAGFGDEVLAAWNTLPEEYRSVLDRVDLAGCTYSEVAVERDCPVGTVMSRLHRARRILKKRLVRYAQGNGYRTQAAGQVP